MSLHFEREVDHLKRRILEIGGMVEEMIRESIRSLDDRSSRRADWVIARDRDVDAFDVAVEEECLKLLALYQPTAIDLRYILAVLRINASLERMADQAVNIAERARSFAALERMGVPEDIHAIESMTLEMVRNCLDSLVHLDTERARHVLRTDDAVDELHRRIFDRIEQSMLADPANVKPGLLLLSVARNLERVADEATNIAEDVVYLVEGEIIRHPGSRLQGERPSLRPPAP